MAKQLARKENVSSIELNVWAFNKNAINFYKELGFTCKSMRYEYNINQEQLNYVKMFKFAIIKDYTYQI